MIFIAVGTPSKENGAADLTYVDEVARTVARNLDGYKVIVTKSTVPVGTGCRIRQIIREENANGSEGVFDVASNPEFLREGSAIEDFLRPNRVIIGANSPQAIAILQDLYRPLYLIETPIVVTTIETAELIKYASNSFLATKISFINELANLCDAMKVDVHVVAKGMGLDQRIGPKFLHPGPGFGGSCFPKDTRALAQIAKEHGCQTRLVDAVVEVNEQQKHRMVDKIVGALGISPNPGPGCKNFGPIRLSSPIPLATTWTSTFIASQRLASSLIKLIFVARKLFEAYLISSAASIVVTTIGVSMR